MQNHFLYIFVIFLFNNFVFADVRFGTGVYTDYFWWQEYSPENNNKVLLTETGLRHGINASIQPLFSSNIIPKLELNYLQGRPNYDGALQNGTPVQGYTFYSKWSVQASLADSLSPFALLHLKFNLSSQLRILASKSWGFKHDSTGYEELWKMSILKLGYSLYPLDNTQIGASLNLPLLSSEVVTLDLENGETLDIHLKPKTKIFPEVFIQQNFEPFSLKLSAQWIEHSTSNPGLAVQNDYLASIVPIYQPLSKNVIYSANLDYNFNIKSKPKKEKK